MSYINSSTYVDILVGVCVLWRVSAALLYIWASVWEPNPGIFGLVHAGKLAYGSQGSQDGPSNWFSTGNSDASLQPILPSLTVLKHASWS